MPAKWLIHLEDGKTLTDADCFPHETEVLASMGYNPENITSVERIISGRHLTIKKSPFIEGFFVATDEGADMRMTPGPQTPPVVLKRTIGCYLVGSEPPVQCRFTMDPRNYNVSLQFFEVKKRTAVGINAKRVHPRKGMEIAYQKEMIDNLYSVISSEVIEGIHNTPTGLAVILKNPHIRAEMVIRSQNCLLGFTQIGQKLRDDAPLPVPEIKKAQP